MHALKQGHYACTTTIIVMQARRDVLQTYLCWPTVRALVNSFDVQQDRRRLRRQIVADTRQERVDEQAGEALGALTEAQLQIRAKGAGLHVREFNALLVSLRFTPQGAFFFGWLDE